MDGFDKKGFGERLEKERKAKGWTLQVLQEEVRTKLGPRHPHTSYGSIWSYVNGEAPDNPRREVVEAMADLFEVRPEFLLYGGPRTEAEASREATGLVHTILERGKLRFSGQSVEVAQLREIIMAMNDFPDVPQGAKDVMTRFLWDVALDQPDLFVNPEIGGVDEREIVRFAQGWFPARLTGSYGEKMAHVLAHAQVAYLTWFGSQSSKEI